jgi:hypothetical protein
MANAALPGFQPIQTMAPLQRRRLIVASAGTKIRGNDALIWGGASLVVATNTSAFVAGSCMGGSYINASGARVEMPNLPSTTYSGSTFFNPNANYAFIAEDGVNTTYLASAASTVMALTDLDLNLIMVLGTTTTMYSDHTLTSASKNTTATFPWRLQGILDSTQADPDTAPQHCLVKLNQGYFEPALTAGLGT